MNLYEIKHKINADTCILQKESLDSPFQKHWVRDSYVLQFFMYNAEFCTKRFKWMDGRPPVESEKPKSQKKIRSLDGYILTVLKRQILN